MCWRSSKQDIIADSTIKVKYIAMVEVAKEIVWIKRFIIDLGVVPSNEELIPLYYNNNEVIAQTKEPRSHQKLKHILRRFHLIKEIIT